MIFKKAKKTCQQFGLVSNGDCVVVACSGGADSMALTHVLYRLSNEFDLKLHVVSVDHDLRLEAKKEVEVVRDFAGQLGIPFSSISLDSERFFQSSLTSSLQAQARQARYEALFKIAHQLQAHSIAVGHHRDDQAETVLARLLGGSGVKGLRGIHPKRQDSVIRPLIGCSKKEILGYIEKNRIQTVSDPSNKDPRFERVRIREVILPLLNQENPKIGDRLADLADEARDLWEFVEWAIKKVEHEYFPNGLPESIPLHMLQGFHPFLQSAFLKYWLEMKVGFTLSRSQTIEVQRLIRGRGEVLLPKQWMVSVQFSNIVLKKTSK